MKFLVCALALVAIVAAKCGTRYDRIQDYLEDLSCVSSFEEYIRSKPAFYPAFKLWKAANSATNWDKIKMKNLIKDVDGFNNDGLTNKSSDKAKLGYTKEQCYEILEPTRNNFKAYLKQ